MSEISSTGESENLPQKNASFNALMTKLKMAEDELVNLTNDELKELLGDIKGKVDNVRDWEVSLKSRIDIIASDIRLLQDRKKTLEGSLKRFREYLLYVMQANETLHLKGKVWDIKIRNRKNLIPNDKEITSSDYLNLNHFAESKPVIDRVYKWNIAALKNAYATKPEAIKDYVKETSTTFIQFTTSKKD